jgi:hypothetical protein
MSALREHPIVIRELIDEGLSPPAWGRFSGNGELIFCIIAMPSGQARGWSREPREDAEIFSARIVRDVIESVRGRCDVLVA